MPTFSLRFSPLLLALCLFASALMPCHAQAVYVPVDQSANVLLLSQQRQRLINGSPLTSSPVATGCSQNFFGISNGTDTAANFQTAHYALYNTSGLRLVFSNGLPAASQQTTITVKATVWLRGVSSGPLTPLPVTFQGLPSVSIAPGKNVVSDPVFIPISYSKNSQPSSGYIAAADYFYVREYVTSSTSSGGQPYWPLTTMASGGQWAGSSHGTSEVDETNLTTSQLNALTPTYTGSLVTGSWQIGIRPPDTTNPVYAPAAILGMPLAGAAYLPCVGLYGDSIMNGTGDVYEPNTIIGGGNGGPSSALTGNQINFGSTYAGNSGAGYWVRTSETLKQPIVNTALYGDAFYFGSSDDSLRQPFFAGCQYVVSEMGINQITQYSDGTSDVNVSANVTTFVAGGPIKLIQSVQRWGCKVILETYPPACTSASGNIPKTCDHTRIAINNYLRANWQSMGAVGLIDKAMAVEADQSTQSTLITLSTGLSGTGVYSSTVPQQALSTAGGAWLKVSNVSSTLDGIHPNAAGHNLLAQYVVVKLPALLTK